MNEECLDYHTICAPIKTYEEVFTVAENHPKWYSKTSPIISRSKLVIANCRAVDLQEKLPTRIQKNKTPKTILCHDMKNGYLEDKYNTDIPTGNGYTFTEWHNIDMFIYFSHHFITIPPLSWIQCAHRNGVQILGTIITEWKDGVVLCAQFLKDEDEVAKFVHALVQISIACKLDGWLINIENPIEEDQLPLLIKFVAQLTSAMHDHIENSLVIWYDSVINTGKLKWQNELNDLNKCFFDVCDGMFLNYSWKESNIQTTALNADHRHFDIFVGIDVFGRNTPYEAGLDCYKGLRIARENNLSIAIFAPGWTHECLDSDPAETFFDRFLENNSAFWSALWPYLYTHPVTSLFDSTFHLGATKESYSLCRQELQLHTLGECLVTVVIDGICYYKMKRDKDISCYNLLATDIELQGKYRLIVQTKNAADAGCKRIDVVLQFMGGKKLVCRPKKNVESVDEQGVIYPQSKPKDLSSICSPWVYNLVFEDNTKLLHIGAISSTNDEVYITRLGLVKNE